MQFFKQISWIFNW